MNRLLLVLPGPRGATDAISIGPTVPRILAGKARVATLPLGPNGARPLPLDQPEIARAFDRLYSGDDDLARSYREGRTARAELISALSKERQIADNGAPPPTGFPGQAARLALLIRNHPGVRVAAIGLGGWDTHINQGNHNGQLADHLRPLGEGLAALARGSGEAWQDTVVVVLSEFGRTFRENGNRGTDHGHGNVIWVLGGTVNGGRVYGDWPGLDPAQLYQRRDLAVTTDFRTVLAAIIERHMRLADRQLEAVLPDAPPAPHLLARSADTGVHDRYGRPEGHARALAGRWRRAAVPDLPSTPAASSRERARATSPGFASHDVGGLRLAEDTAPRGRHQRADRAHHELFGQIHRCASRRREI
jgi:uncharacterized protein (DUF1501 family)